MLRHQRDRRIVANLPRAEAELAVNALARAQQPARRLTRLANVLLQPILGQALHVKVDPVDLETALVNHDG